MDCRFARVALEDIDEANVSYRITTPQDKPPLEDSIQRVGLISPLIVKETADQSLVVVSGFRRIDACRRLGWRQVPCRILPPDASQALCLEIAITDNSSQRALNLLEQARCLQMLFDGRINNAVAQNIAANLGIPTNHTLKSKLNRVISAPDSVQDALVVGIISLPTALQLVEMATEDAHRMTVFFKRLPMSLNRQRELLVLLKEIAIREDISLQRLLSEEAIQDVLADEAVEGNQKARCIRSYLRKRRFPRLTAVEEAFQDCVRELKLERSIQISPPPAFEGRHCTMTIRFKSKDELERASRTLSKIVVHPALSNLFNPI